MSTLLLKHSLLLIHGTVYGQIDPLEVFGLSPKSANIDQWHNPAYSWLPGLLEIRTMPATSTGTMTNNAPVDLVHWTGAGGFGLSPMVQWNNCLKLLVHI